MGGCGILHHGLFKSGCVEGSRDLGTADSNPGTRPWVLVRFALRFPHTFYVLAALIVFLGVTAIRSMPTDIFPQIDIPVVTVIWSYTGLSTPEMEQRVSTYSQYSISSNVTGIKNMESQTLNGISVQKIYFQPDVNLDLAISQIVSATNAIRALMPPGIQPPIIVQFNASSVPVLQLTLTSNTLNEQQLYDYGIYRLRQQLAPIARRHVPNAGRRQIPADHGRSRSEQAARQGADAARRGERGQRAESDAARRHRQDRRQAIHHQNQLDPRHDRRPERHSAQICQRRHGVHEGYRAGPRRLCRAAEHRAQGWPARGAADRDQERQRLDARRGERASRRRSTRRVPRLLQG